ncbi:MAG TPA: DUF4251 domain-containing protein [Flavisolibacter sp.]|nr:DUF4251 domain-containing protein [Flavisolibacter sp.]
MKTKDRKTYQTKARVGALVLAFLFTVVTLQAQQVTEKSNSWQVLKAKLDGKRMTFVAQAANPARGSIIQLTNLYDLQLKGDTLVAALPFFGRAFTAPVNMSDGGIRFTSTNFLYEVKQKKNKRWDVRIIPNDNQDVRQMYLSIFPNGSATLQVLSNSRESMSFTGYIKES